MESQSEKSVKLSGKMIALMAAASGIAVANIYFAGAVHLMGSKKR